MKFSVIGHKKIGASLASLLKKKGLDAVAFYSEDIQKCVECAVEVGCKAYTDFEATINESELIILALEDISLRNTMRKIAAFKAENKIFLALSYAETSDTISIGNENTYFSVFVPKVIQKDGITDLSDVPLLIEGDGKDFWDLYDELYVHGVNFEIIDRVQKHGYNIAAALVSNLISTFCTIAENVLKDTNGELKNVESFAYNTIFEVIGKNDSIEKADFGKIIDNLSFIKSDSAKKIESIYKVLRIMSKDKY